MVDNAVRSLKPPKYEAPTAMRQGGLGPSFPLDERLDAQPLTAGHLLVAAGCSLVLLIDGYDLHVTGQLLPAIAKSFHTSTAALAVAFAVQTTGQAVGSLCLSPFADRFGRRPIVLFCLLLFGLCTLASTVAVTPQQFTITRFIGGALGGALMPVTISLAADLAPTRWRSTLVGLSYVGLSVGPLCASLLIARFLEASSWKLFFYIGGALPLLLLPLALGFTPESARYLASRNPRDPRIPKILSRIGIHAPDGSWFTVAPAAAGVKSVPILDLFRGRLAWVTFLIWMVSAFTLIAMTLFGMLPTFFHDLGGVPLSRAAGVISWGLAGSLAAAISAGFLMDHVGPYRILVAFSLAACLAAVALALVPFGTPGFAVAIFAAGFFFNGAQQAVNIVTPALYPSRIRAAGVGWKGGVSRFASGSAPLLAAFILIHKLNLQTALTTLSGLVLLAAFFAPLLYTAARPPRTPAG